MKEEWEKAKKECGEWWKEFQEGTEEKEEREKEESLEKEVSEEKGVLEEVVNDGSIGGSS